MKDRARAARPLARGVAHCSRVQVTAYCANRREPDPCIPNEPFRKDSAVRILPIAFLALGLSFAGTPGTSAEPEKLPKVVLIGDSIRLGYAPAVAKKLDSV